MVNFRDALGLRQKVQLLIEDSELRGEIAAQAYRYARTVQWGAVAQQYLDLIGSHVSSNSSLDDRHTGVRPM